MQKPNQLNPKEDAINGAVAALRRAGFNCKRPNRWQLKINYLSFYPTKGTIYRDGEQERLPQRGLDELIRLISQKKKPVRRSCDDEDTPVEIDFSLAN
jgi:hypothetical protein